jgi:glyoxylate utilization-related uncharacterized protein
MDDDGDGPAFVLRAVTIAPGSKRAYAETEWQDAIVLLRHGEIELECLSGSSYRFARGDLLWLAGLPLRALHNRGHERALLVAVSRR